MTPQELLHHAAEIKAKIKALTEEYKDNEEQIIAAVYELNPKGKVDVGDLGRFSVSMKKEWEYSDKVETVKAQLKALKEEEEALGLATYKEIPSLKFIAKKTDEL